MKSFVVTGASEWVAGRRVRPGDVLQLTDNQAEYELARGLIREAGASVGAAAIKAEEDRKRPRRRRRRS